LLLEICAFNIQSCIIAEKAGAGRIELCADPLQGGTTPSFGLIEYALHHISIPIFPMIRPRGSDFIYDDDEMAIMKKDILVCRQLGCPGIATGMQSADKRINTEQLKRIVEWAHPMQVTCHKVFDQAPDALQALEDVITTGCSRILTSGLQKTALEGAAVLSQLISQSAGRIIIMPGGGVRSSNIAQLIHEIGATEYHSSALLATNSYHTADELEIKILTTTLLNK